MIIPEERRRRDLLREQRRDAGRAFLIVACVIAVAIAGGMLAVAWLEGRL